MTHTRWTSVKFSIKFLRTTTNINTERYGYRYPYFAPEQYDFYKILVNLIVDNH